MIRNIIFDVGNVLVSYDPDSYMERMGLDEETKRRLKANMFEHQLWLDADQGLRSPEEFLEAFTENAPDMADLIRRVHESVGGTVELFDYAVEWILDLKDRGYHVYILSNYSENMFRQTEHKLKFLPLMDGAVFSYTIQEIKPNAAIYNYLCDEYGLEPEESVFIDDLLENVAGAERVGIHGICFCDYAQAKRDLDGLLAREGEIANTV